MSVGLTAAYTAPVDAATKANAGYLRFERGPESMFGIRRVQIFYAARNLLENVEHYNNLYCATNLMTSNSQLRSNTGLIVPRNNAGAKANANVQAL